MVEFITEYQTFLTVIGACILFIAFMKAFMIFYNHYKLMIKKFFAKLISFY